MRRRRYRKQPIQKKESSDQFLRPTVQTKLNMGKPGDKYEVEADNMADKVVNNKKGDGAIQKKEGEEEVQQKPLASSVTPLVQKMGASEEENTQAKLQRKEEEEPVQQKEEEEVQKKGEEEEVQAKEEEVQKKGEEDEVQAKEEEEVQKKGEEEEVQAKEEEEVQKKGEEEEVQAKEEEEVQKKGEEEEVQAKEDEEAQAKEEEEVQAKSNGQQNNANGIEKKLRNGSGGQKMDANTQAEMEHGFGADFNNVRIHNDAEAQKMSKDIGAQAFTHGNDIYFSDGKYNPNSKEGKHLLAHELTHTIQQNGAVAKKETPNVQRQEKKPDGKNGVAKPKPVQVNLDMDLPGNPSPTYQENSKTFKALEKANLYIKAQSPIICNSVDIDGVTHSYVESVGYSLKGSRFEYLISESARKNAEEHPNRQIQREWAILMKRIKRHAEHHFFIYRRVTKRIRKEMMKDLSRLPSKDSPVPISQQLLYVHVESLIRYWDSRLKYEAWKETCAWEKKGYPRILKGLNFSGRLTPKCGEAPQVLDLPMIPWKMEGSPNGNSNK